MENLDSDYSQEQKKKSLKKQTQPKTRKARKIKVQKIYFIFSQVNPKLNCEQVLAILKEKNAYHFLDFVISQQHDKNGKTHFHVLLIFDKLLTTINPPILNLQYQEEIFQGEYQSDRFTALRNVVEFVCQKGHYITSFSNLINGKFLSPKQKLIRDVKDLGVTQRLLKHVKEMPESALAGLSLTQIAAYFNKFSQLEQAAKADEIQTPFKIQNFNLTNELKEWIKKPDKTLILVGNSGIGKTQFCKAFVKEKKLKTLLANHKEDFSRLDRSYDAILLDDATLTNLKPTELLAFVDSTSAKTLRVLYKAVSKKEKLVQMVTMNKEEFKALFPILNTDRFARRITFQVLKEPFIDQSTVNIEMDNKSLNFEEYKKKEQMDTKNTLEEMQKAVLENQD